MIYIEKLSEKFLNYLVKINEKILIKNDLPMGEVILTYKNVYGEEASNRYKNNMSLFSIGMSLENIMAH